MHLEIFTEDRSGAKLVDELLPKLIGPNGGEHTWRLVPFSGIGKLPTGLRHTGSPRSRAILNKLPAILQAYGKMVAPRQRVVVLVDNDFKDCIAFKREIMSVVDSCKQKPAVLVRIAVRETESWMLGDPDAVLAAFPKADKKRLRAYRGDVTDGTWENLADAINLGDSKALKERGYPELGKKKFEWAERIGPNLDPVRNNSESFKAFALGLVKILND